MKQPITLRLAEDADGPAVGDLLTRAGMAIDGMNMDGLYPYWIVAERDGALVGTVQVMHGRPVGAAQLLAVEPELSSHAKGRVVRTLLPAAFEALRQGGAQVVRATIPFKMKGFKRALKKRGCVVVDQANVMEGHL